MKKVIKIKLLKDFELLCKMLDIEQEQFFQYYLDRISLPRLMSIHPEDPEGLLTDFFLKNTPVEDTKETQEYIEKKAKGKYHHAMMTIAGTELEQPECEEQLRVEVKKWRDEYVMLRKKLKEKGRPIKIINYGN
ncbi:hypothetical protein [Olivibacter jilunii]|uniref:hypothetical protein n=1 Tax=Olivibacter jilunii TaxID=985016 RepID=UPI003F145D4E